MMDSCGGPSASPSILTSWPASPIVTPIVPNPDSRRIPATANLPSAKILKVIFQILGEILEVETFAAGKSIRELPRLRKLYGAGRWRKRKGFASIRLTNGTIRQAEIHWYEAFGIGKKEFKLKRFLN
jgi:hypothetical protein